MKIYTQRELRELVTRGAVDLTNHHEMDKSLHGKLNQIGYAVGVYGCNGKLFEHKDTKQLYAITTRSTAVFIY